MVGMLGCGCCKCCPEGNVWSYNYYPQTQGWPLKPYNAPGIISTPNGLEFRSPPPFSSEERTQQIYSVEEPVNGQDPPIKIDFAKLDLRNLKHQISAPTNLQIESWVNAELEPNTTQTTTMAMRLTVGLAVRRKIFPFAGYGFGLDFIWYKKKGYRNGKVYFEYKQDVHGWTSDEQFNFRARTRSKTYGPSPLSTVLFNSGEFVSHELALRSDLADDFPARFDCTAYKQGALTQEKIDNLLLPTWVNYAPARRSDFGGKGFSCFPYYLFEVEWAVSPPSDVRLSSFANSKILLRQTDWKYGNQIDI